MGMNAVSVDLLSILRRRDPTQVMCHFAETAANTLANKAKQVTQRLAQRADPSSGGDASSVLDAFDPRALALSLCVNACVARVRHGVVRNGQALWAPAIHA